MKQPSKCDSKIGPFLEMWVIYDHPRDYPLDFVVRKWRIGQGRVWPTDSFTLHKKIENARASVPHNTIQIWRCLFDDHVIIEVWV